MVCGDYLSLPLGHGGYKQVGLYVDVYSGFVWATKLKSVGTAKSTIDSLSFIIDNYVTPDLFMADRGTHFRNKEVGVFVHSMASNESPPLCTHHGVMA